MTKSCRALPEGYRQVFHIDAKEKKTGIVLTLVSLVLTALPLAVVLLLTDFDAVGEQIETMGFLFPVLLLSFSLALVAYLVLHELTHGVVYKMLTGEKLTFGISWSCAFCGVPDVYVSRRVALLALLAPFTVFTLLFLGGAIAALLLGSDFAFLYLGVLFSLHFGGCVGDLWMTILLFFRFRDKRLLMRDTGPEQFLYLPEDNV